LFVGYDGALVFNIEVGFLALSWFRYCHFKYSMSMAKMNGIKKNTMFLLGRTWRKLHLAIDENHQVLTCELSTPELDDPLQFRIRLP
jgi:hypothetical protein